VSTRQQSDYRVIVSGTHSQSGQGYSRPSAKEERQAVILLGLMGFFSPLQSVTLPSAAGSLGRPSLWNRKWTNSNLRAALSS